MKMRHNDIVYVTDAPFARFQTVATAIGSLIGAVASGRDLVVATRDYLLVYDGSGMLVDQLEDCMPRKKAKEVQRQAATHHGQVARHPCRCVRRR